MGFPDYPIPESDLSYLPAEEILQFLNDYADHFGVRELIKVNLYWPDSEINNKMFILILYLFVHYFKGYMVWNYLVTSVSQFLSDNIKGKWQMC